MNKTSVLATAVAAAVSATFAVAPAMADKPKMEKCYGVVKAKANDCQTATSSCAGTSTVDGQKDAWVLVPAGLCDRLVGGSKSAG